VSRSAQSRFFIFIVQQLGPATASKRQDFLFLLVLFKQQSTTTSESTTFELGATRSRETREWVRFNGSTR